MKTVLINGGSRGIGAAAVRAFCKAGYAVAFTYLHSEEEAKKLSQECGALAIKADSSSSAEVRAAVERAFFALSHIDVLVNNAAISLFSLFTDITDEDFARIFAVNVNGPFYYTKAVLPDMIKRKAGRIINISSIFGQSGASCEVHYSATKAALIGLSRALAKEVGPSGITVNCIAPGVIDTDMNRRLDEQTKRELCEGTPLGRMGTPGEVAEAILYLAGENASFITGQVLTVDGGFLL